MSERSWPERLGERIRELREAHGMTQQELGAKLGVSRQSVSEIENGKSGVTLDRLSRVLDVLGYEVEMFFVRKDEESD